MVASLLLSGILSMPPAAQAAERATPISAPEFARIWKELVPSRTKPPEPWESIGWRIDLLAARDEAVKAGKPLFLWAMNGHPLGCT